MTTRLALRLALLGIMILGVFGIVRGYSRRNEAHRDIAQAYAFILQHAEVSSHIPCFCGCGKREGHSSLDSCFVSRRDELGGVVSRDPHAESCKVCIDVALKVRRMFRSGQTVKQIRAAIESEYPTAQYPLRTDTSEPPEVRGPAETHRER